jgi:hypothetical protein
MDIERVTSADDFITFVRGLVEMATSYDGPLEKYLSSVLRTVLRHSDECPTWQLLAHSLARAFDTLPASFNRAWLVYSEPPALATQRSNGSADAFDELLHLLRYQIADLHRMAKDGTLKTPFCDGGIDSPTGHRWFNFNPASFLECASRGMRENKAAVECSWSELAHFLWLGQIYE